MAGSRQQRGVGFPAGSSRWAGHGERLQSPHVRHRTGAQRTSGLGFGPFTRFECPVSGKSCCAATGNAVIRSGDQGDFRCTRIRRKSPATRTFSSFRKRSAKRIKADIARLQSQNLVFAFDFRRRRQSVGGRHIVAFQPFLDCAPPIRVGCRVAVLAQCLQ